MCSVYHNILLVSSPSHVHNTLQPYRQLTKLGNITISIKIEVIIKFGASETMYEPKSYEMCTVYYDKYLSEAHPHTYITHFNHVAS